jgi:hypothetical protein
MQESSTSPTMMNGEPEAAPQLTYIKVANAAWAGSGALKMLVGLQRRGPERETNEPSDGDFCTRH